MGRYYGVVVRNYSNRWRNLTQAEVEATLVEKVCQDMSRLLYMGQLVIRKNRRRHSMHDVLSVLCITCIPQQIVSMNEMLVFTRQVYLVISHLVF